MDQILEELSTEKLIQANDDNFASWVHEFEKQGTGCIDRPRGTKRTITDITYFLFNAVLESHLVPEEADQAVQTIVADGKERHVSLLWQVGPTAQPTDLPEHLKKHGFALEDETPIMAADLTKLDEFPELPEGLSIEVVRDDHTFLTWTSIMLEAFGVPLGNGNLDGWYNLARLANPGTVTTYLGKLDGEPVATAQILLGGGVAGVYCISALSKARGKGIGRAITRHAIMEAKLQGYKAAILQSSKLGYKVYESLGFKEIAKLYTYRWVPTA